MQGRKKKLEELSTSLSTPNQPALYIYFHSAVETYMKCVKQSNS